MRIRRSVTSPYHPQSNGLTERTNQTLCRILRKYIDEEQKNWADLLPWALLCTRTTRQASTKQTPAFLAYGTELALRIDLPKLCCMKKRSGRWKSAAAAVNKKR